MPTKVKSLPATNTPPQKDKLRIYLAGPFFNDTQVAEVRAMEKLLAEKFPDFDVFSPSRDGVVIDGESTVESRDKVFQSNVMEVTRCDFVVALMADKDRGTAFELGLAYGQNIPVIAVSFRERTKLNLMLANSFAAWCRTEEEFCEHFDTYTHSLHMIGRLHETHTQAVEELIQAKGKEVEEQIDMMTDDVKSQIGGVQDLLEGIRQKTMFSGEVE